MENESMQKVIGGLGDKKSNNGSQYFQQDRVYDISDISICIPAQLSGGGINILEIFHIGSIEEWKNKQT